ncbi:hypothetical protein [Marinitoga lauensis]|uniref:hypothetical protein n=1 Tax=Marinitoga lauensis TaxID=2201189 RepID=UPI001011138C|nr:hypothetical protein [Marinitoga lauensis]
MENEKGDSIFFISCTNVEKLGKNVENSNDLESYLYDNNVIKTSEYYTKDGFLVFKNYFEGGKLVKQEIFDKEGNIEYIFEIKNEKIFSIKNSRDKKYSLIKYIITIILVTLKNYFYRIKYLLLKIILIL